MYNSILVPLDGSAFAEHALPFAISLARKGGAAISLVRVHIPLHTVYTEGGLFFDEETNDHFRKQELASLDLAARKLKNSFPDANVETKLLDGEVAEAIAAEAANGGHDLVVMTTHGRGAIGRILLGSVADQLIRFCAIPLLLIHPDKENPDLSKEVNLQNILIPLDGRELAEQILEPATALGSAFGAKYTLTRIVRPLQPVDLPTELTTEMHNVKAVMQRMEVVHKEISHEARTYLQQVADKLRSRGLTVESRIDEDPDPATAILRDLEELPADAIALSTHARHGLPRLFLGSVANKLIHSARVPILVRKPKKV